MTAGVAIDKLAWIVCQRQRGADDQGTTSGSTAHPRGALRMETLSARKVVAKAHYIWTRSDRTLGDGRQEHYNQE